MAQGHSWLWWLMEVIPPPPSDMGYRQWGSSGTHPNFCGTPKVVIRARRGLFLHLLIAVCRGPPFPHQDEGPADNRGPLINQGANCSTTMAASPPWAFVPFALAGAGAITLQGRRQVPLSVGQASATHPRTAPRLMVSHFR